MSLTWDEAIQRVLRSADGAMHYADIAERIASEQLRDAGANPAATVAATLSQSLRDPGSPFQRVGKGEYALSDTLRRNVERSRAVTPVLDDSKTGALRAFGMFWQRDLVNWAPSIPKLLGRQSVGASQVDFADEIGVYLLHDRERVIYVGRAVEILVSRLRAHTNDRLGGRWDRFSWFGLRSVGENGNLLQESFPWNQTVVIETLEALLIESLEPPLNRRRGDNFSAVEYLQVIDPQIEMNKKEKLLDELASKLRA
jgi:hypothetical protein